jgi:hypothetical protein
MLVLQLKILLLRLLELPVKEKIQTGNLLGQFTPFLFLPVRSILV